MTGTRTRLMLAKIDTPARVGRRLFARRVVLGFSQRDLAFPGCSSAYLSRIERGDRVPSLQVVEILAERLLTTPEWILRGSANGGETAMADDDPSRLFTVWKIRGIGEHGGMDVQVVIDSSEPLVIEAIEDAAKENGIELERIEQPPLDR